MSRFLRERLGWGWPHLLLVTVVLYGPVEKLLIPWLGGYLNIDLSGDVRTWVPDLEALLTGFVEFPFFFAYYLWSAAGMGEVFIGLRRSRSFADEAAYERFLERVQASFDHRGWSAIGLAFSGAAMALWHFSLWGPKSAWPPWFGATNTPHRILALLMIGLVGYAVGQILVRELLTLRWLRRLCVELGDQIVVHPYHADDAGGLGSIAHHALALAFFLVPLLLFFTMGSLLPSLRGGGPPELIPWSLSLTVGWLLFMAFLATSLTLLFWPPHRVMVAQRDRKVNEVSRKLDELLAGVDRAVGASPQEISAVLAEIAGLKDARELLLKDLPVWPLNTALRLKLGTTSLISFLAPGLNYVWAALLRLLGAEGR